MELRNSVYAPVSDSFWRATEYYIYSSITSAVRDSGSNAIYDSVSRPVIFSVRASVCMPVRDSVFNKIINLIRA